MHYDYSDSLQSILTSPDHPSHASTPNASSMPIPINSNTTTMASSSIGSDIFALGALLLISLLVLFLLRHFLPLRTTPAYLLTPIFLALALPTSIILLVPIDLASTSTTNEESSRGIWLPERVLLVSWRIAYWLTFVLTWYVMLHRRLSKGKLTSAGSYCHYSENTSTLDIEPRKIASSTRSDRMRAINSLFLAAPRLGSSMSSCRMGSKGHPSSRWSWHWHTAGD